MGYFVLSLLLLLAVVAPHWGADSRDGRDWQPWPQVRRRH